MVVLLCMAWLQRDIPSVGVNCLMGVALTCTLLLPRFPRMPLTWMLRKLAPKLANWWS